MAQINKPSDYFNTKLYTGTGSSTSITGVGFQPDLVYTTSRSNSYNNGMFDSVRGVNKLINTNTTSAEASISNGISSFDSDGFSFSGDAYNTNAYTFASWNWLGANGTAANTDGSISSTVSASTTSGFSIVSYTGTGANATVGHGLGSAPSMIIIKNRSDATNWNVYTTVIDGSMDYLYLNLNDAKGDSSASVPTSTLLNLTASNDVNGSSDNMIAYCFAEKKGFSKFGSYTGNGNADGTFVYTGFKPAFVMVKRTDSTSNWLLYDNRREGYNQTNDYLNPDNSNAEVGGNNYLDLLSNGFKTRVASQSINVSGASYIYMAFAENPLVGTNNIPATAR